MAASTRGWGYSATHGNVARARNHGAALELAGLDMVAL